MQRRQRPTTRIPENEHGSVELDGPSVFGPIPCRNLLAVVTDSIYLLKPESGKVVRRFSWKPDRVSEAECNPKVSIVILKGAWPGSGDVRLVGLSERGIRFTETCRAFLPILHYSTEKKLIYVSHVEGIDIRRPDTGDLCARSDEMPT